MEELIPQEQILDDLCQMMMKNQEHEIKCLLENNQSLNLTFFRDAKCNSLLHRASFNNNSDIMIRLCEHQTKIQQDIRKWVNAINQEGFSPIFVSCYKGNLSIVQTLMKYGADLYQKSAQGLYVLHAAAQGDSPVLLKWFIINGMDVNYKDERLSSALHWAVFAGSENAVNYLLAWKIQIDDQDSELGYTALHLAAIQGYTKIVRKLLVRGANRNIKDYAGKTALDIATEKDYPNMKRMLIDKIGIQQFCNIKQPFRPLKKNFYSVGVYLVLFLSSNAYIFYIMQISELFSYWVSIILGVIALITSIIYIILLMSDPGTIRNKVALMDALIRLEPNKICPDCEIIKPARSKHCEICKCCQSVYDHHCPWVNNCIGAKNYVWFCSFLCMLAINMTYCYVILILNLIYDRPEHWPSYIILMFFLLISSLFYVSLLGLMYIHTKNLIQGITTQERFAQDGQRTSTFLVHNSNENTIISQQSLLSRIPEAQIEEEHSCSDNWKDMCWRNGYGQQPQRGSVVFRSSNVQAQVQVQDKDSLQTCSQI